MKHHTGKSGRSRSSAKSSAAHSHGDNQPPSYGTLVRLKACQNCRTEVPKLRPHCGREVCDPCYYYKTRTGYDRVLIKKKPEMPKRCFNCGVEKTRHWCKDRNKRCICINCRDYYNIYGFDRPRDKTKYELAAMTLERKRAQGANAMLRFRLRKTQRCKYVQTAPPSFLRDLRGVAFPGDDNYVELRTDADSSTFHDDEKLPPPPKKRRKKCEIRKLRFPDDPPTESKQAQKTASASYRGLRESDFDPLDVKERWNFHSRQQRMDVEWANVLKVMQNTFKLIKYRMVKNRSLYDIMAEKKQVNFNYVIPELTDLFKRTQIIEPSLPTQAPTKQTLPTKST